MKFVSKPSKPEAVEAIQFNWGDWKELNDFLGENRWMIHSDIFYSIQFRNGHAENQEEVANNRDWIVKINNQFCITMKADDFAERFMPIRESSK